MNSRSIACSWALISQAGLSPRVVLRFDEGGRVVGVEENCADIDSRAQTEYYSGVLTPELVELCEEDFSLSRAKASLRAGVRLIRLTKALRKELAEKKYTLFSPLDAGGLENNSYLSESLTEPLTEPLIEVKVEAQAEALIEAQTQGRLLIYTSQAGSLLDVLSQTSEVLGAELASLLWATTSSAKAALGLGSGEFVVDQACGCTLVERGVDGALSSRALISEL